MVRIITVDDVKSLIRKVTLETFLERFIEKLTEYFSHWNDYEKIPRFTTSSTQGMLQYMPFWGTDYYSFKYVSDYPLNPKRNKNSVVGIGMLADMSTGYPVFVSEMTLLTALRTAATSALAGKFLARKNPKIFAIIGTGAQSEFQTMAYKIILGIDTVKYFDSDPQAMQKFSRNMQPYGFNLIPCSTAEMAVRDADVVTTATDIVHSMEIVKDAWVKPGMMLNAIGGDAPGKTELDVKILHRSKIVVEYIQQTQNEGEIQNYDASKVYAELWELVNGIKPGRQNNEEIFVFDSVGFALEDYAILKFVYSLAEDFHVGHMLDLLPVSDDPKDLFGVLKNSTT